MISKFNTTDAAAWADLRTLLEEHGYATSAVRRLLNLQEPIEIILGNVARYSLFYLDELSEISSPAAVLARLFMFSGRANKKDLNNVHQDLLSLLWRLHLLEEVAEDRHLVRATASITEYEGRFFAADLLFENKVDDFSVLDQIGLCMPPHASSLALHNAVTSPVGAESFLDVGCGTGCQSILAASSCSRTRGFDPYPRAVMFARVNALLNQTPGEYTVDRWEAFESPEARYDHIAYNANTSKSGFGFINHKLGEILSDSGLAQVFAVCEVTEDDADLAGLVRRQTSTATGLDIRAMATTYSEFSLSRKQILAADLPADSLLVADPSHTSSYFDGLADRHVIQVCGTILEIRHA